MPKGTGLARHLNPHDQALTRFLIWLMGDDADDVTIVQTAIRAVREYREDYPLN